MTQAQERLAALVEWISQSSANDKAPLGGTIVRGPYALIVPKALDLPPDDAFAAGHLPLWIPEQQAIPGLPPVTQGEPQCQDHVACRLQHLIWTYQAGRFQGVLIPLTDPAESLQAALDRHAPGLDLEANLALFLPLWRLFGELRAWADAQLPLVRV
jgi:hypothetical protein